MTQTRAVDTFSDVADAMHEHWLEQYHALGKDYEKLFELMSSVGEHDNYFEQVQTNLTDTINPLTNKEK